FKWVWGPQYLTKPLPHCRCWREHQRDCSTSKEAAAKSCAVPDLRQQLPLVIQRQEAQGSCQSSTKDSTAGLGCWDPAELELREMGGAFLFCCRKPPW
ncbi:hypothetical protein N301_15325, partial [Charadrius vociferus]